MIRALGSAHLSAPGPIADAVLVAAAARIERLGEVTPRVARSVWYRAFLDAATAGPSATERDVLRRQLQRFVDAARGRRRLGTVRADGLSELALAQVGRADARDAQALRDKTRAPFTAGDVEVWLRSEARRHKPANSPDAVL